MKFQVVCSLLLAWSCFSQDWIPLIEQKGQVFHAVEYKEGMSLVAMLQATSVPSDTFKKDNPSFSNSIDPGTRLFFRANRSNFSYTVVAGDTPYGIAKKYAIRFDSLNACNLDLQKNGLKVGQRVFIKQGVVRFPVTLFEATAIEAKLPLEQVKTEVTYRGFDFQDTLLLYQVKNGETIHSVAKRFFTSAKKLKEVNGLTNSRLAAGTTLKIPLMKDTVSVAAGVIPPMKAIPKPAVNRNQAWPLPKPEKKFRRIGVFLPFGADTVKIPTQGVPKNSLEFYMGAKLAIDSLNRLGCEGEVQFFDCWSESESVDRLVASDKLKNFDLLVGPMQSAESEKLAQYCAKNKIPMVLQGVAISDGMKRNPFVFTLHTEIERQIDYMVNLAVERSSTEQIILYRTNLATDTSRETRFLQQFRQLATKGTRIISADLPTLKAFLMAEKPCVIFCLSTEKSLVVNLTKNVKSAPVVHKLIGLKEWTDWKELNASISNESDFFYFSTGCMDYSEASVKVFHKKYRSTYGADLSKYALFGFDIIFGFSRWISGCGNSFPYQGYLLSLDYRQSDAFYHGNYGLQCCRFRNFKQEKNASLDE